MGRRSVAGMLKLVRFIVSLLALRVRSRAVLEPGEPRPTAPAARFSSPAAGRLRLFAIDRLLWVLLYRLWPRCLEAMVLVKPAKVIQWHRQAAKSLYPFLCPVCPILCPNRRSVLNTR
jgi:hypothetical protein